AGGGASGVGVSAGLQAAGRSSIRSARSTADFLIISGPPGSRLLYTYFIKRKDAKERQNAGPPLGRTGVFTVLEYDVYFFFLCHFFISYRNMNISRNFPRNISLFLFYR
ncbi:MAG: hypothetical protein IIU70_05600, partial [Anaerotignum sp.]|nr:hypothetical protein [Anaerotignum sp.]